MNIFRRAFLLAILVSLTILFSLTALASEGNGSGTNLSAYFDMPTGVTDGLPRGDITVEKETIPECAGDIDTRFDFDLSGDDISDSFKLCSCCAKRFNNLPVGTYIVTEKQQAGWKTESISCSGGNSSPISNGVAINLADGDEIICTFTSTVGNGTSSRDLFLPIVLKQ